MDQVYRTRCVLLGLLCLMPALFFWAISSMPIEMDTQPVFIFFSGATLLELIICGFIFPIFAMGLGWNAYKRCENKALSLVVVAIGFIEVAAASVAVMLGKGF